MTAVSSPLLVIGRNGQLARALVAAAGNRAIVALGSGEIDLMDPAAIYAAIEEHAPESIINTAAYTAVDRAEAEPEAARALNAIAAGNLAVAARDAGCHLIHVSTDYVFSGQNDRPWREDDPIDPKSVYGTTKAEGEALVLRSGAKAAIVRTSWLYAETGQNFLRTMLRLGAERDRLEIVADQIGAPTWTGDLAPALIQLSDQKAQGIVHLSNSGETSWHGFAEAIFAEATKRGMSVPDIVAKTTTAAFGAPAPRPLWSKLDCSQAERDFGIIMPDWRDALARCFQKLDYLMEQE